MRYHALVCDYDGTLALDGKVSEKTLAWLGRLRKSGRRLVLVTGRELDDLMRVFSHLDLFDRVVAENGALLYRPATREEKLLCRKPPEWFINILRERGVAPLSVGRVIISTREPNETAVLEAIRDFGVEMQVIFNKGAVMILPSGVNKASGLSAALSEIGLSPHNVVGVGDAENDNAFLSLCECSVAVANALPVIKEHADFVTTSENGAGVSEIIDKLIDSDLSDIEPHLQRHEIPIGTREDGQEVRIKPYGMSVFLCGNLESEKSKLAAGFLERLAKHRYQFCIIDPEGDYRDFQGAVVLGNSRQAPVVSEVIKLLENPDQNSVINLIGIPFEDRPSFFKSLLPALLGLRARTGRPHWIVIDRVHCLIPLSWASDALMIPSKAQGMMFITAYPDRVFPLVLSSVDMIIVVGESAERTIYTIGQILGQNPPPVPHYLEFKSGGVIVWWRRPKANPFWMRTSPHG